jgi:exodeoxyribonuclease V beta subunit
MTVVFDVNKTGLEPGILLLEASAGTGKTWSLTSIAVRLLLEGRVDSIDRLLLVTFTRAATDELRQRLRDRLHEAELVLRGETPDAGDEFLCGVHDRWGKDLDALKTVMRARRDVDQARVRTIHSFCLEVLAEGAFEAGLPLDGAAQTDGTDLLRTAFRDTVRELVLGDLPFVVAAIRQLKIDPEGSVHWKILQNVRRRSEDDWRPVMSPLDEIAARLLALAEGFDLSLLGDFVAEGKPRDWRTADRNESLRAANLLAVGFDPADPLHQAALLKIVPSTLRESLTNAGLKRFTGSALEAALAPLGEEFESLGKSLPQLVYRKTFERYTNLKDRHALIDYDDIIARTWERLDDPNSGDGLARRIANSVDAALVDEFQDTDSDQWKIFRRIFAADPPAVPTHLLLLVGDPKQAIYRFRGADIFAYLEAREAADRTATLMRNWRSTPALVNAVNSIFGRQPNQSFALAEIVFTRVKAGRDPDPHNPTPMEFVWVDPGESTATAIEPMVLDQLAADIIARRKEFEASTDIEGPRSIAVLVRSHRNSRAVMQALREVGIDAVLARGGDIHQSEAMGEWRIVLRALLDPSNLNAQRRARATRIWGSCSSELGESAATWEEVGLFSRLRKSWTDFGVATMASELLATRRTIARWLGEDDGERGVTDLRHGLELLNREESMHGLGPEALVRWAEAESRIEDQENDERPLRLDRQSDAVQVMTNFTSKGLQYDTVYLPYAWTVMGLPVTPPVEVRDPDTGASMLDFDENSDLHAQATLEELASQLRLHYVELTRAKERCVIYLAPAKKFPISPAAFVLARDEGEADGDRAAWALGEQERLADSVADSADRIEALASAVEAIRFRSAEIEGQVRTQWPAPQIETPEALEYPAGRRRALAPWRQLSYTALVRSLHEQPGDDPIEFELPLADRSDPADAPESRSGDGIFGFARGARAGICLHELLEHAEFTRETNEEDLLRVTRLLSRHGLGLATAHPGEIQPVEVALDLIERLRHETLPFGSTSFAGLTGAARLDEWEFSLPVVDLVPREIARLLDEHWKGERWVDVAARRLARLPVQKLQGMLGGFVDLLFVNEGRWTVLDWKSNDLGGDPSNYSQAAMQRAMIEHDYLVQVLFYTVAAQRYLRTRIADYDYDRHMAGASYVFLRGLSGDPELGWCNVRPPRDLVDALDALFAGGAK